MSEVRVIFSFIHFYNQMRPIIVRAWNEMGGGSVLIYRLKISFFVL